MKLIDLNSFMIALGKFKMLNMWQLEILTWFFPVVELFIGLLLIFNIRTNTVSIVATFMLTFFTAVIISKIFEGEEVSCGCFGKLTSDKIDYITFIRNIVLLLIGILLSCFYKDEKYFSKEIVELDKNKSINKIINYFFVTLFFLISVQTIILALQNVEC